MKVNIADVQFLAKYDDDPDLSWLGTFDRRPKTDQAINHRERTGDRDVMTFFNPGNAGCDGYTDEYCEQDYQRMVAFESGEWFMVGVFAVLKTELPRFGDEWYHKLGRRLDLLPKADRHWRLRDFTSGGLWGIESDGKDSYYVEVWTEELYSLARELQSYGIKIVGKVPEHLVIELPFDREYAVYLTPEEQKRIKNAIRVPGRVRRFGRWFKWLMNRRYNRVMKEIAAFQAA